MHFYEKISAQLEERKAQGNFRELPLVSFNQDTIMLDSVSYTDLSSNDYLCIARDAKFLKTFFNTMMDTSRSGSDYADHILNSAISTGSTGSRLLTGNHLNYAYCEDLIASLYNGALLHEYNERVAVASLHHNQQSQLHEVEEHCLRAQEMLEHEYMRELSYAQSNLDLTTKTAMVEDASKADSSVGDQEQDTAKLLLEVQPFKARSCLYINSGFDANEGVLSTLFGAGDLLLVDKLCHASIIDGMLKSKAKCLRFAHNNMEHLAALLEQHASQYETVCIVTESIFSMDGDCAWICQIAELKKRYSNVLLYVDEAHSFGLFGDDGLGICRELKVLSDVDFLMGTLSKAIGSQGAFLLCDDKVKSYLVNFMRPFIYATALPPVNVTFSMYVIGLLKSTSLQYKREYLRQISRYMHVNLSEQGLKPSYSQIQPLITGDNDKALKACEVFKRAGLLALSIRHPTVPKGEARLRVALNCSLRIDDIDLITSLVKRYRKLFVGEDD